MIAELEGAADEVADRASPLRQDGPVEMESMTDQLWLPPYSPVVSTARIGSPAVRIGDGYGPVNRLARLFRQEGDGD